jgi:hypothetical protein
VIKFSVLGRSGPIGHVAALALATAIVLGTLAACGKDEEKPTPTATAAATVAPTAPPDSGTPPGGTGLTVGDLADRIGAAWSSVSTYRRVTTTIDGNATNSGSPTSRVSPNAGQSSDVETIDEVILPDRRRRIARTTDGAVQYELVAVGGKVYARGALAPGLSATRPDPNAWVEVDPTAFDPNSPDAPFYADLIAPAPVPYSALSPEERSRDAVSLGQTTVDGRSCTAYRFVDTTETGERIEIVLSLGADDLPCSVEIRGGGQTTTSILTYNAPLTIDAPAGATPISIAP